MGARLSKDERRAVAQHIFAALCAHYPDRYVALFERPQVGASSPERVLTSGAALPVQDAYNSTDDALR